MDAVQELDGPASYPKEKGQVTITPADKGTLARRVLGVTKDADFDTLRKAFERLNKRSDPAKFPDGSPEQMQAAEIQKRVHWAYRFLTDDISITEKRFRSLEIE